MKKKFCRYLLMMLMVLGLSCQVQETSAAGTTTAQKAVTSPGWNTEGGYRYYYSASGKKTTGWKKLNGKLYYFRKTKEGKAPKGSMAVGFVKVKDNTFYFSKKGVLQTGWQKIGKKYYYFEETGNVGVIGKTSKGFKIINDGRYFFDEDGSALTGWQKYKSYTYYCCTTKKLGTYGRAIYGRWCKIDGYYYCFRPNGVLYQSQWIRDGHYVDQTGRMLTNCVTPDGWVVDSQGKQVKKAVGWVNIGGKYYYYVSGRAVTGWKTISSKRYYFDTNGVRKSGLVKINGSTYYLKNGVMQTGWVRIKGSKYYFKSNGKMVKNTTVNGIKIDKNGVADVKTSVLILSGHGQGDQGAVGKYANTTCYEYEYTRQFAKLVEKELKAGSSKINVVLYDQNYDCYQVLSGKKSGPKPDVKAYDYVFEIHFNATVESMKDPKGNGKCKGVSMYINSAKTDTELDREILKAVVNTGMPQFGIGIFRSSGLFNAKTCQNLGVSYALLETAFIDDLDDMKFYSKNKAKMAKAVAGAIIDYFE